MTALLVTLVGFVGFFDNASANEKIAHSEVQLVETVVDNTPGNNNSIHPTIRVVIVKRHKAISGYFWCRPVNQPNAKLQVCAGSPVFQIGWQFDTNDYDPNDT